MALVIEVKNSEAIKIGNDVIVKVVGVRLGRVSVAIKAPREVQVKRLFNLSEIDQQMGFSPKTQKEKL